jgi:hypothetical protein
MRGPPRRLGAISRSFAVMSGAEPGLSSLLVALDESDAGSGAGTAASSEGSTRLFERARSGKGGGGAGALLTWVEEAAGGGATASDGGP